MISHSDFELPFLHHPYPFSIGTVLAVKIADETGFARASGRVVVSESNWQREFGNVRTSVGFRILGPSFLLEWDQDETAFHAHCVEGGVVPTPEARAHFMAGVKAARKVVGK